MRQQPRRRYRHASPSPDRQPATTRHNKTNKSNHYAAAAIFAGTTAATVFALYYFNYTQTVTTETLRNHPDTKKAFEVLAKWFYPYSITSMAHNPEPTCVGMASNLVFAAPLPIAIRASVQSAKHVAANIADSFPASTSACDEVIKSLGQFVVQQTGQRPHYQGLVRTAGYIAAAFSAFASVIMLTGGMDIEQRQQRRAEDPRVLDALPEAKQAEHEVRINMS